MNVGTGTPFFDDDEHGIGRAAVKGAIIAALIVGGFVLFVGLFTGAGLGASLGMGAFAAFFGGPGFGGMLGAVSHVGRHENIVSTPLHVMGADQSRGHHAREPSRLTTPRQPELVGVGRASNDRSGTKIPRDVGDEGSFAPTASK